MIKNCLKYLLLIDLIILLSGCSTTVRTDYVDSNGHQPWVGLDARSTAAIYFQDYGWSGEYWVEWYGHNGIRFDARDITRKSDSYAQAKGIRRNIVPPTYDNQYQNTILDHQSTIVCLSPIVIVIVETTGAQYAQSISIRNPDTSSKLVDVTLDRGFNYGTKIPYSKNLFWYSPSLKHGLKSVQINSRGIGEIEVAWGRLIFMHEGDYWIVTTSTSK